MLLQAPKGRARSPVRVAEPSRGASSQQQNWEPQDAFDFFCAKAYADIKGEGAELTSLVLLSGGEDASFGSLIFFVRMYVSNSSGTVSRLSAKPIRYLLCLMMKSESQTFRDTTNTS